jgi:hypothetical protein
MPTALLLAVLTALAPQEPKAAAANAAAAAKAAPQIEWQRTLADALAVQKATGRPLLLCVNSDGETFCEQFAANTYHDAAFVAATRGYVCLLASGDRHNDSDYDGLGRRIECPRFPGLLCSEHQNAGTQMLAKYFKDGTAAPRHVGIDKDGVVLFDRFLDRSMETAIDAVKEHAAKGTAAPLPQDAAALLNRRDAAARAELERRWLAADATGRIALLRAAAKATGEPFDLLRLGLRADEEPVFEAAATALAAVATKDALIDVEDAIARSGAGTEGPGRELLGALQRLARTDPASAQFAAHLGAVTAAQAVRQEKFVASMQRTAPAPDREAAEAALDAAEKAARAAPKDPEALLTVAQRQLDLALALPAGNSSLPLVYEDSRRAAERALAAATTDDQRRTAHALLAIGLWQQGERAHTREHAAAALALCLGHQFDASPRWFALLLGAAARAAAADAYEKVQTDATAVVADDLQAAAQAFVLLSRHAACTEADLREAAALLAFAGARFEAGQLLAQGIARWPASRELHADWRNRVLADRGAERLRAAYATWASAQSDRATAEWFAGYAAIVAAEVLVKDHRRGPAGASYSECIERFGKSAAANPDYADSANHFAVLAHAGRALLRHEDGDDQGAVDDLLAALRLRPASMTETDGLGRKPEAVLQRIADELRKAGKNGLADQLPKGG